MRFLQALPVLLMYGLLCSGAAPVNTPDSALRSITSEDVLRHVRVLASDAFEGRAPATRGEELTVSYLIEQFKMLRLEPGNPDGSYIQKVPLMGITSEIDARLRVKGTSVELSQPAECILSSLVFDPLTKVTNSEVVFVGYGVVAPEYQWDDFKGLDVRGKTLIVLINDPPLPDPNDPSRLDERMFKGRAMTYYGRWTYKYEIAAEKGAAAAIIVHETGPAGYPYMVVAGGYGRETFDLKSSKEKKLAVQGWMTWTAATNLFARAGLDPQKLKSNALKRDFTPVPLHGVADFMVRNKLRPVDSQNVVAKITGSEKPNEYVIYTAHWDHLGRNEKLTGDQIYNGALDNATGTAGLLEVAKAFRKLDLAPKRTVVFLCVTAEEKGLLGSKYYAEHPLYSLEHTLCDINMDGLNPWGATSDIEVVGYGQTTLEDELAKFARAQERVVKPDSEPQKGRFYRSDHFEFAKVGVPGLYIKGGVDLIGKPPGFGKQKLDEYTERDYHKLSDEIKPDWNFDGAVADLRLLVQIGNAVAQGDHRPEWKEGSEFKAKRRAATHNAKR
ncbi:MAG: M20/M25/M40 family metallo-hydrolase [Verrucomicrobia subdivision 3 bacterium]|nr:M20/M25/M40 family metallo-hydrolase [Limisphaerales bacterium]